MDGWLCSYGRGPNSASVTMLGGPRTPADLLIPPNYLVALMQTRRRTFIVERYFSHGLQSRSQAERRTAMRNPKQGQCASPPHVSKQRSCREERVDLHLREAHGSETRCHHRLSPDERSGIRIGDLNCLGLRSAPRVDLLQEAAARNCSLNCPAETLSTFRPMTGPEAMNSASSSGVISYSTPLTIFFSRVAPLSARTAV
ncbi:hypothetical protein AF71_00061050 [Rhizobium sp. 57MFTsu3.2]|nr:hypothetical protein [Rhizobium sp. 57MFTsu3.2]